MPGKMVHACNPSTQEAEAERSQVWGQLGPHSENLSQNKKKLWSFPQQGGRGRQTNKPPTSRSELTETGRSIFNCFAPFSLFYPRFVTVAFSLLSAVSLLYVCVFHLRDPMQSCRWKTVKRFVTSREMRSWWRRTCWDGTQRWAHDWPWLRFCFFFFFLRSSSLIESDIIE
jgi:hypothetical protein